MFLRKLLDPEEAQRRRVRRARIVRRNRIQRDVAQGLPVRHRRVPRASDFALSLDTQEVQDDRQEQQTSPFRPSFGGDSDQAQGHPTRVDKVSSFVQQSTAPGAQFPAPQPLQTALPASTTAVATSAVSSVPKATGSKRVTPHVRARWRDAYQRVVFHRHEEILAKDPKRKWRQERFGLLLFARQEYLRASEHLRLAIELGANSGLCWRRLAQSYFYVWETTAEWDVLWDCRAAYEQALNHVEVACSPLALIAYARVLELLGHYTGALTVCALVLQNFPRLQQLNEVKLRFVLLQRYQLFSAESGVIETALSTETLLIKCVGYTQELLLDKSITEGPRYLDVLYLHTRLNELLVTSAASSGRLEVAPEVKLAQASTGVLFQELFKTAAKHESVAPPPGIGWKAWKTRSETYTTFAEHFRAQGETVLAADALSRSLELLESLPEASDGDKEPAKPWEGLSEDQRRKRIAVYVVLGRNYYQCNQMEKAIRAMEAVFQLDPLHSEARASLTEWFPAKWQYRLDLEDSSQVQVARVLRGIWGRQRAAQRRVIIERHAERSYLENPYHLGSRRLVLRWLRDKYAPLFAAQDLAARRLQHGARRYLYYARIRWALEGQRNNFLRELTSKQQTRKYRYNHHVRSQLAQLLPDKFERRFLREDISALRIQRCFRGGRVRRSFRRLRDARREQLRRQYGAAQRIQRFFRRYRSSQNASKLAANELVFRAQHQLVCAKTRLAVLLQGLYRRWKSSQGRKLSAFLVACEADLEIQRRSLLQEASALKIQRLWRRYTAVRAIGGRLSSHAQLLFIESFQAAQRRQTFLDVNLDHAARKIQAAWRGKLLHNFLGLVRNRILAPPCPSPVDSLISRCEVNHRDGVETLAQLYAIDTLAEKCALFDHPVVILCGPRVSPRPVSPAIHENFSLQHVVSAMQYSQRLRCLVCASGDFTGDRITTVLHALQTSRTLRVLALGAIETLPDRSIQQQQQPSSSPGGSVEASDASEGRYDNDRSTDSSPTTPNSAFKLLLPSPPPSPHPHQQRQPSAMQLLSKALRTTNFLLEELYLERNALLERPREGALVADFVADYFFARYGRLHTLVVAHMRFSDANAALLGAALAINTVLQRLDLHGNLLCDRAAVAIADEGLAHNTSLVYLNLAENAISSAGGKALFRCLATRNRTLRTLILSNNQLLSDVVPPFVAAWQVNATLETVDLAGNLVHEQCLKQIGAAVVERHDVGPLPSNAELRLLLARKRFGGRDHCVTSVIRGLGACVSPLTSPVRSGDRKKVLSRKRGPLSPKKWLHANAFKLESPLNHPVAASWQSGERSPGLRAQKARSKASASPVRLAVSSKLPALATSPPMKRLAW